MAAKIDEKKIKAKGLSNIALSKSVKISQAEQYTLIAVLGAGIALGIAIALASHFADKISYNAKVIEEEDKSIVAFSDTIKEIGICTKPNGKTYSDQELEKCRPNAIEVSAVPNTLRSKILQTIAANKALNSVPKEDSTSCINSATGKNYTYQELQNFYTAAETDSELAVATELIQNCSALRVIPDALPQYRNEEALLSSLNKIFDISDWEPEGLSPTGTYGVSKFDPNLNSVSVRLSVDSTYKTTMKVLENIERSIREFDIERATIEWSGTNSITLQAQANAYYITPATYTASSKTINSGGGTTKK